MHERQTEFQTYTRDQLLEIFERRFDLRAALLSWSLPDAFRSAARPGSVDYLQEHYRIAVDPAGKQASYYEVRNAGDSCAIYIGYGRSVDPRPAEKRKFSHILGGKDQSGRIAIETTGTDYDRLEIYIGKLCPQERYQIRLADPFRSKVYPNKTAEDKERLVSLAGALMRLIHAGKAVDLAAIKAEIDILDPERNNPATLINAYYASPAVRKLVDDDRKREGKRPFHDALAAGEITDIGEMKLPRPALQ